MYILILWIVVSVLSMLKLEGKIQKSITWFLVFLSTVSIIIQAKNGISVVHRVNHIWVVGIAALVVCVWMHLVLSGGKTEKVDVNDMLFLAACDIVSIAASTQFSWLVWVIYPLAMTFLKPDFRSMLWYVCIALLAVNFGVATTVLVLMAFALTEFIAISRNNKGRCDA